MFAGIASSQFKGTSTDLKIFDWNEITIPSSGMTSGTRWGNSKLRADMNYQTNGLSIVERSGKKWLKSYVNPRELPAPHSSTGYDFHFRSEFTEWPWPINGPLDTEEWLGFSYIVPDDWVQPVTSFNILQYHPTGLPEAPPSGSISPVIALEVAYPGQLNSSTIYRKTPNGGEIQMINNAKRERWVHPAAPRWVAGQRLDFVLHIISSTGSSGLFETYLNGVKLFHTGFTTSGTYYPPGNTGSTVFDSSNGFTSKLWQPNWKLGLYHHALKDNSDVEANEAVGHNSASAYISIVKRIRRFKYHPEYRQDAFHLVDTSSY